MFFKKNPASTKRDTWDSLEGYSDYLYPLILVSVIFGVFVLLAGRPEAVTGNTHF